MNNFLNSLIIAIYQAGLKLDLTKSLKFKDTAPNTPIKNKTTHSYFSESNNQ